MIPLVVDPSVIGRWAVPEAYHEAAVRLLLGRFRLMTTDAAFGAAASVLLERERLREIALEQTDAALHALVKLPLEVVPTPGLASDAFELARLVRRPFDECCLYALAFRKRATVMTADLTAYRYMQTGPLAPYCRWVGDIE